MLTTYYKQFQDESLYIYTQIEKDFGASSNQYVYIITYNLSGKVIFVQTRISNDEEDTFATNLSFIRDKYELFDKMALYHKTEGIRIALYIGYINKSLFWANHQLNILAVIISYTQQRNDMHFIQATKQSSDSCAIG